MRLAEKQAIEHFGLQENILMEHAALALVERLVLRFGKLLSKSQGIVVAGKGNNGGDVLAAARLLLERGSCQVLPVLLADEKSLSASAQSQLSLLKAQGFSVSAELTRPQLESADWILDGIVGTGLTGPLSQKLQDSVALINSVSAKKWVISADLPSGLDSDTGKALGAAVKASETVAFGFLKRGLTTGDAAEYAGKVSLATIQVPRAVRSPTWVTFLYSQEDAALALPLRKRTSHKGNFGHVSVVAGLPNQEGASALAALGALRTGAGLVSIHAPSETLLSLRTRLSAEIQTETLDVSSLLSAATRVLVIGPGLGVGNWDTLAALLGSKHILVLDADALNLLSANPVAAKALLQKREPNTTVLTPHPKEAARLMASSVDDIERDRFRACQMLTQQWNAFVVLKGAGSICSGPGAPLVVVTSGDSGLSKGGSGDVLAGIAAALMAQGLGPKEALPLSVYLHGRSSELITLRNGHSRSTLASEVAGFVTEVIKELECLGS